MNVDGLICKLADTPDEIEQIHRLNYRTFVEEIPQHTPNSERKLVDKFHKENSYLIIKDGDRVVGMLAMRDKRPFSLDAKLPDLNKHLPKCERPVEGRLLAVEPEYRGAPVLRMILDNSFEHAHRNGWDLVIISGTVRQLRLYRHLGFEPFGPLVGTGDALFQPMFVRPKRAATVLTTLGEITKNKAGTALHKKTVSLLPGPLTVSTRVLSAMSVQPFSHRSALFQDLLDEARRNVCRLVNAEHCQMFPGSGTLANDMVSLQLARHSAPGLVLVNGEFGKRIAGQAKRAGMTFKTLEVAWGEQFTLDQIRDALDTVPVGGWVWWVHHETSTGIINPLHPIAEMARERKLTTAVDVISSSGNIPVDLANIDFATAVSGKGLCGYPGIGIVFHRDNTIRELLNVPSYLDLGYWIRQNGVGFTHSSNLVSALATALAEQDYPSRFKIIAERDAWLRLQLAGSRFSILATGKHACPAVLTLIPRHGKNAWETGLELEAAGYVTSYRSNYLRERNWLQISLMGAPSVETLTPLLEMLKQ